MRTCLENLAGRSAPVRQLGPVDLERCSVEGGEGAGPGIERPNSTFQLGGASIEIQPAVLLLELGSMADALCWLRNRLDGSAQIERQVLSNQLRSEVTQGAFQGRVCLAGPDRHF